MSSRSCTSSWCPKQPPMRIEILRTWVDWTEVPFRFRLNSFCPVILKGDHIKGGIQRLLEDILQAQVGWPVGRSCQSSWRGAWIIRVSSLWVPNTFQRGENLYVQQTSQLRRFSNKFSIYLGSRRSFWSVPKQTASSIERGKVNIFEHHPRYHRSQAVSLTPKFLVF